MEASADNLIDVFRFVVRRQEGTAASSTDTPNRVMCLDISSHLSDKNIIEENDDKPWDKLQQILFERLLIEDYASLKLVPVILRTNGPVNNEFSPNDSQILRYLYGCYYRLQSQPVSAEVKNSLTEMIASQVILYLSEPDVFPDREKRIKNSQPAPLLLNLVSHYYTRQDMHTEVMQKFVNALGELNTNGDTGFEAIIAPTYTRLSQKFLSMAIDEPTLQEWFTVVRVFMQHPALAQKLLEKDILRRDNSLSYQSTLLGFMLSISHLPRTTNLETTFFKNMRFGNSDHKFTETQLGIKLKLVAQELHKNFRALLKMKETKNMFLTWIGRCLHTFRDRKKLWNNQVLMATNPISVNDGFLLNFLNVMLLLSEPFAGPYKLDGFGNNSTSIDKKLLKIDPRYCKWSKSSHENCSVHFLGLSEETFLIKSAQKSEDRNQGEENVQPNFISECFFGTHQAFTYGFRSVYERFFKLAQTITELEQTYASALAQGPPPPSMSGQDPLEMIKQQADAAMTHFYNLKAALMVPSLTAMQLQFCIATAVYLNHLVACQSYEDVMNSKDFKTITVEALREKKLNRSCLEYIPEMLIENILDFFLFLKNFNSQALAQATGMLEPLMTLMITFMGDSSLMQNPHLRARFAEILECLMPHQSTHPMMASFPGCAELFELHPLVEQLAPALVNVFVSIEMTGEGVQFEQKFSYRRPMYLVLEYLWDRPFHRQVLIQLADEAEKNIDSARPPLFLRFVNLLMNDAIFLLDEALSYMNQLREAELRKKSPEWQRLTHQQRAQAENTHSHIGRLARFHNVLSMSTIGTIAWLTREIKTIFCHTTLVDRIANMLNYFLEHLVGPKKGKFNVTDKNDYEFKPKEILEKICQIYINLGDSRTNRKYKEFCSAVSSDGRSYSETLLPQATDILFRTGMSSLGTEFEKLSGLVKEIAQQNKLDEVSTEDIPDTFLDPIMSTLMLDPVLLPSSNIIVDRSTIARHLLSDQTDPFNRSPLSMEDVIPEVDLKRQIETFLKDRRQARIDREADKKN